MARSLAEFVESFVVPFLAGGEVRVGAPIGLKQRNKMMQDAHVLFDTRLLRARERRAQLLVSQPLLGDPDQDEVSLWVVAHNAMVFDHPEVSRVWARESTWQRYLQESIDMLDLQHSNERGEYLRRFVVGSALVDIERDDFLVRREDGVVRYRGQVPPHLRGHVFSRIGGEFQYETVRWYATEHQVGARTLLGAIWASCPLTCMIHPELAPASWSPTHSFDLLQDRSLVRAACYMWGRRLEWVDLGGYLLGRLLTSYGLGHGLLQEQVVPRAAVGRQALPAGTTPNALSAAPGASAQNWHAFLQFLAALIHLHLLKVFEFDARLAIPSEARRGAAMAFLALPLHLEKLAPLCGTPLGESDDPSVSARWEEYRTHLASLIPKTLTTTLGQLIDEVIAKVQPS